MGIIIAWLGRFLVGAFVGELVRKAAMFATIAGFFYLFTSYIAPLLGIFSPAQFGSQLKQFVGLIQDPTILWLLRYFQIPYGLTIIVEALVTAFIYRLIVRAAK